jgi:hypothetical protein
MFFSLPKFKTNHFGINPNKGGIPLKDRKKIMKERRAKIFCLKKDLKA